jgi:hypothetical protein
MKIYLDDVRDCPKGWLLYRTAQEVINIISSDCKKITHISFDHDLGTEDTGYDVAKFIEYQAFHGNIRTIPQWKVHSSNPVGRRNIQHAMLNAEKYVKSHSI